MICESCKGNGCKECSQSGQILSIEDQTFIRGEKKGDSIQVFAVQGNYKKELLAEIKYPDKQAYFDLIEKIRKQPNVKFDQASSELNRVFQVMLRA